MSTSGTSDKISTKFGSSNSLTSSGSYQNRRFQVLKEISRGTMSTVYYCEGGIALKSMGAEANPDAIAIY